VAGVVLSQLQAVRNCEIGRFAPCVRRRNNASEGENLMRHLPPANFIKKYTTQATAFAWRAHACGRGIILFN
jgi:hypothetical protein